MPSTCSRRPRFRCGERKQSARGDGPTGPSPGRCPATSGGGGIRTLGRGIAPITVQPLLASSQEGRTHRRVAPSASWYHATAAAASALPVLAGHQDDELLLGILWLLQPLGLLALPLPLRTLVLTAALVPLMIDALVPATTRALLGLAAAHNHDVRSVPAKNLPTV